jgi:hypothetical protein
MEKSMTVSLPGPASHTARLPLLVEISLTVTQILVVVVAGATAILSIIAQADLLTIFIRTVTAILGIGIPAFLLNWLMGRFFVEATVNDWMNSIQRNEAAAAALQEPTRDLEANV